MHFDDLMERTFKRIYILRVCKGNDYRLSDLDYLLISLIICRNLLFVFECGVWLLRDCAIIIWRGVLRLIGGA